MHKVEKIKVDVLQVFFNPLYATAAAAATASATRNLIKNLCKLLLACGIHP